MADDAAAYRRVAVEIFNELEPWAVIDGLAMLRQLGFVPSPGS